MHDLRLIAMYLPQFHPISENNMWWGEGFTEWTNVRKAVPRFQNHYQPHAPRELGYYDLRDSAARAAQAALAREYGIYGFCYYHYWFNGKRLLETPLNEMLRTRSPDFPFCLCWANENWTRRWDGAEHEVLLAQQYGDQDSRAFAQSLVPAFMDERYIRVEGKPLFLVYRTGLLPDAKRTAAIWREELQNAGVGDIYLVRIETSIDGLEPDPEDIGFDAAVEFAPNWGLTGPRIHDLATIGHDSLKLPSDVRAYDYVHCMWNMLKRPLPDYKLFRGVFPSWDNTPRRLTSPDMFLRSSPAFYSFWLTNICKQTIERMHGDERLVFVNAWNEWGEGCHLEPDEHSGVEFLQATRMALQQISMYAQMLDHLGRQLHGDVPFSIDTWYECFKSIYEEGALDSRRSNFEMFMAGANLMAGSLSGWSNADLLSRLHAMSSQKDERIRALQESVSWKLTQPLRWCLDMVKKVGGKG